jgi:hypothetical protein
MKKSGEEGAGLIPLSLCVLEGSGMVNSTYVYKEGKRREGRILVFHFSTAPLLLGMINSFIAPTF